MIPPAGPARRAAGARAFSFGLPFILILALAACAPRLQLPGPALGEPRLNPTSIITSDGAELPLHQWPATGPAKAVLLALHGFNDYGAFIGGAAGHFAEHGVQVYAYDQRGFGRGPHPGIWPGKDAFADDLATAARLLRRRHPGLPLYLLGASMGGAVIMSAMVKDSPPVADGVILAAPAVWGRRTMPFYQRWALALSAHTLPWLKLSGRGLKIKPSDNIEMLRALGRDPLIIKETRVDTIWGLVNLMDAALAAAPRFQAKALILYGENDEVIRQAPTDLMLASLPAAAKPRQILKRYPKGYHMLMRDLQGDAVWRDIVAWMGIK